jgi:hypothetical protein
MSAVAKSQVIAKTIDASNLSDADLRALLQKTAQQNQTADVKVVLGGVIKVMIQRGLINPAALVAA